jgi:hypothetical protein
MTAGILQLVILLCGVFAGLITLLAAFIKLIHTTIELVDKAKEARQKQGKGKRTRYLSGRLRAIKRLVPRRKSNYIELSSNNPPEAAVLRPQTSRQEEEA